MLLTHCIVDCTCKRHEAMELQNEIALILKKCKSGVCFGFVEILKFVGTWSFCKVASEITVTSVGGLCFLLNL